MRPWLQEIGIPRPITRSALDGSRSPKWYVHWGWVKKCPPRSGTRRPSSSSRRRAWARSPGAVEQFRVGDPA
ncbi:hypothetical protein [Embleya sp. NPDC005575]|uniref:hypothetical protein n=1 Tax=Embleya sp. NPDC005575 TaxID=3156892 RepID=UPI0033A47982